MDEVCYYIGFSYFLGIGPYRYDLLLDRFKDVKGLFVARNRVVFGLSKGVVLIEGAKTSGALITAKCALSQGRCVFALPGQVTSVNSEGPHELLKVGGKNCNTHR